MKEILEIGNERIARGHRKVIELHLGRLYDCTELTLSIEVIRSNEPGPIMFISGAIHGDELTGVAIIKSIINDKRLKNLKGTLIAIPIVNVFGYNNRSRYLPDRRDLNRCFPGSPTGSLAARIAHLFMEEVVKNCQYGIDFHAGAVYRSNLPQIRTTLANNINKDLAEAFGVAVVLDSELRDGSLREAAEMVGVKTLLFEGGEALRLNVNVIRAGVRGTFAIMEKIGMLPPSLRKPTQTYFARSSYWVRAPQSGILGLSKVLGSKVKEGTTLSSISDAFGKKRVKVIAPSEGVIIGVLNLPLVNVGDALFHIATFKDSKVIRELSEDLLDYN